jgi:hypothetical protein
MDGRLKTKFHRTCQAKIAQNGGGMKDPLNAHKELVGALFHTVGVTFRVAFWLYQTFREPGQRRDGSSADNAARTERKLTPPEFSGDSYWRSDWWHMYRRSVLAYLGDTCEFCGDEATGVHHARYPKRRGEESIRWLFAVCSRCHDVAHGRSTGDTDKCAFCCGTSVGHWRVRTLKGRTDVQAVCSKCQAIARGRRHEARGWSYGRYNKWVSDWWSTLPQGGPRSK